MKQWRSGSPRIKNKVIGLRYIGYLARTCPFIVRFKSQCQWSLKSWRKHGKTLMRKQVEYEYDHQSQYHSLTES